MPGDVLLQLGQAMHDLCQPITTLQCHLELASLLGTPEADREAVRAGMAECERIAGAMAAMREAIRAAMQQADREEALPGAGQLPSMRNS